MIDIAAYAAHPDDLEIQIGGTLALHSSLGYRIMGFDLTKGEMASNGTIRQRIKEAQAGAAILGLANRLNLGLPDTKLQVTTEQLQVVVESIRQYQPQIILAPFYEGNNHPDHQNCGLLLKKAVFFSQLVKFKTANPPHKVQKIYYYDLPAELSPSFIVDISNFFNQKVAAIKKHCSQVDPDYGQVKTPGNAKDFWAKLETQNAYWGLRGACQYGEPFYTEKTIQLKELLF